jgi:hypothetical protein
LKHHQTSKIGTGSSLQELTYQCFDTLCDLPTAATENCQYKRKRRSAFALHIPSLLKDKIMLWPPVRKASLKVFQLMMTYDYSIEVRSFRSFRHEFSIAALRSNVDAGQNVSPVTRF